jgi:hypothetical protein
MISEASRSVHVVAGNDWPLARPCYLATHGIFTFIQLYVKQNPTGISDPNIITSGCFLVLTYRAIPGYTAASLTWSAYCTAFLFQRKTQYNPFSQCANRGRLLPTQQFPVAKENFSTYLARLEVVAHITSKYHTFSSNIIWSNKIALKF